MTAPTPSSPAQGSPEAAVFQHAFSIRAPRARVWEALTDPGLLSIWFAEHAQVEPRVGGKFRFWGRHTPSFGREQVADQVITAIEPGVRLAFDWSWCGGPTHCELRLADAGEGTTELAVAHRFPEPLEVYGQDETCWVAKDFWQLAAGNLDHFCRTGRAALLPDHSAGGRDGATVDLSIEIDAPAEAVWRGITEPGEIAKWLGSDPNLDSQIRVDLRPGGVYSFGWEIGGAPCGPQEILELEPRRRLVYSWRAHGKDITDRTEWLLEPLDADRTRLTVRQFATGSAREFSGYANGWGSFMLEFKRQLEV
ncbi:MAG: SRPBCC domain-containing protein [Phycisphaerales bacterium JB037]